MLDLCTTLGHLLDLTTLPHANLVGKCELRPQTPHGSWELMLRAPLTVLLLISSDNTRSLLVNFAGIPGLILTGLRPEPRNFFYSHCRVKPHAHVVVASLLIKSEANINLIVSFANIEAVGDVGIARDLKSDSEETTSTSREINKAMEARQGYGYAS
ncbi:hypothetical protein J1N35_023160 [Gossypium stocksii]|uniref:Uncharacterized protein n=1 Tax=Gossypium stocksii TaxID=47602 RepID=A0A9D3VJ41_9ROSI|nr:hypothetical protein J1N35_023160 [Gossypium stocksii]